MSDKIIFALTSSCVIWDMAPLIASDEPCTSDFTIIFKSSDIFSLNADSCVAKLIVLFPSFPSFASWVLVSDKDFASFSLLSTKKSSPAFAAPFIPRTSIGDAGKAWSIFFPKSLISARALPHFKPQTK